MMTCAFASGAKSNNAGIRNKNGFTSKPYR
jgi:hypothetical protein